MTGDPSALIPDDASVFFSGCHRTDFRKPCQPDIKSCIQDRGHQQFASPVRLAELRGLPAGKDTDRRSASPRMTESSLPICSAIPNRTDRFRASRSNNSDEIRLLLPPDAKSNPASTTSGSENIESTATISAKPSWKAAWSGVERSMYRLRKPSSSACVVSCATTSCERQVKTGLPSPPMK